MGSRVEGVAGVVGEHIAYAIAVRKLVVDVE